MKNALFLVTFLSAATAFANVDHNTVIELVDRPMSCIGPDGTQTMRLEEYPKYRVPNSPTEVVLTWDQGRYGEIQDIQPLGNSYFVQLVRDQAAEVVICKVQ